MNLAKLLAAGKSIINGRQAVSYRANKNVYLPKFGSPRTCENPAPAQSGAGPTSVQRAAAPVAAKTQKIPPWPPAPAPTRATTWTSKLNPISRWRESQAAPEEPRPAVQSELSLDSVKVVHNDLSDAEVEVVPIKSRAAEPPMPALAPPERAWEFLAERMFHS